MEQGKETYRNKKIITGVLEILTATAIWGYSYILLKDSLNEVSLSFIMLWRYISASLGLLLFSHRKIKNLSVSIVWHGVILGFFLYFSQCLQTMALVDTDVSAGNVAFITALYVVFVPFIVSIRCKRLPEKYCLVSIVLAVSGLVFLTGGWRRANDGDWLALAGSLGFSLHIVFTDYFAKEDDAILLSMMQYAGATIWGIVVCLIVKPSLNQVTWSVNMIISLLYMGIVSTMLGFLLQTVGQKKLHPEFASLLLATEAVFGMAFSVAFSMEQLSMRKILGVVLMVAAIIFSQHRFFE